MAIKRKKRARRAARRDVPRPFKPRPRKSLITEELIAEICDSVRKCNTLDDSAELAGVARATVYRWVELSNRVDEKGQPYPADQIYRDFSVALTQAESARRRSLKGMIHRSAEGTKRKVGDWRAAQALGAMTDPEAFVPKLRVHVETELGVALDRLEEAFADDPVLLERALAAVSGRARRTAADPPPAGPTSGDVGGNSPGNGGGETVHAPPAQPEAAPVPGPDKP